VAQLSRSNAMTGDTPFRKRFNAAFVQSPIVEGIIYYQS
jgi:hypothetical protein